MRRRLSPVKSFNALVALLGLLCLFAAALIRFFLPGLRTSAWSLLALGGLLILFSFLTAFKEVRIALLGRRGRYSSNTLIMVLFFLGIAVLVNFLGATNYRRFDVTAAGQFTLAPETQRILRELEQPVKAIGFFPNESYYQAARQAAKTLLTEYSYHSPRFDFQFVDPDAEPSVARQYEIKGYGTIVFDNGERQKKVTEIDELAFTSAILEVTGLRQKKVYFLDGHGERDTNDISRDGFGWARQGLLQELYEVETLSLVATPEVPQDSSVLVIAGPTKSLSAHETKAVEGYLERGGKLLVLADPNPPPEVEQILANWGIALGQGAIVDEIAYLPPDTATPAVFQGTYPPVVVTQGLDTTYFPDATSVGLIKELTERTGEEASGWPLMGVTYKSIGILPVAITTDASWLETSAGERRFDEGVDTRGPLALGSLVLGSAPLSQDEPAGTEMEEKLTRIAVIGDSDFAANEHFNNGGNGDLFLNSVSWLAEEERLISIRPKPFSFRRLVLSEDAQRFILYSTIGLLPLVVLVGGGIIWWRRR